MGINRNKLLAKMVERWQGVLPPLASQRQAGIEFDRMICRAKDSGATFKQIANHVGVSEGNIAQRYNNYLWGFWGRNRPEAIEKDLSDRTYLNELSAAHDLFSRKEKKELWWFVANMRNAGQFTLAFWL